MPDWMAVVGATLAIAWVVFITVMAIGRRRALHFLCVVGQHRLTPWYPRTDEEEVRFCTRMDCPHVEYRGVTGVYEFLTAASTPGWYISEDGRKVLFRTGTTCIVFPVVLRDSEPSEKYRKLHSTSVKLEVS